ncbi:hypothetical protein SS50377_25419 [Spironucleus salmonicida]|uniref:Uncharacterized protein n=1 Tax=Spironucleus salmonicida TaxID=348837 RepID=V6LVW7_9EUKA|nr:hypothetical protein SS50377_25419 [Spironucleus salmonicida]|eukprot:EST44964.1 Hypothetical protein SS50377_14982 [Spironucleus salmonicida]
MTNICKAFNGSYEYCQNISCYSNGCAVFTGRGQCNSVCRNSCQNGQYVVCINNKDTGCTLQDLAGQRQGSYACIAPLIPIWAIVLIVLISCIITAIGLFFLFRHLRKQKQLDKITLQNERRQNRLKMLQQAQQFDETHILEKIEDIDDGPLMLVGRGSGVF